MRALVYLALGLLVGWVLALWLRPPPAERPRCRTCRAPLPRPRRGYRVTACERCGAPIAEAIPLARRPRHR